MRLPTNTSGDEMNLIEQLGGYEKAKKILEEVKARDHKYAQNFERPALEHALLQYRREHGIYEAGDKIVFVDDFMHGKLMVVAWTRNGEVWMDGGSKRCTDLEMIRHATDAEIKANKREVD